MAIAVGSVSNTPVFGSARTTTTVTAPASIANGDLLVALLHFGNGATSAVTVTPPAGWTQVTNSPSTHTKTADPYTIAQRVYYKVAASESGNYNWTHTSCDSEGYMYRLTGQHATTQIDVSAGVSSCGVGSAGNSTGYASITTVTNGCFCIYSETFWNLIGVGAVTGTTPTVTVRRAGTQTWIGDGTQTTAGATGARTRANGNGASTGTSLYEPWCSIVVAIRPASGAAAKSMPPLGMQRKFFTRRINR